MTQVISPETGGIINIVNLISRLQEIRTVLKEQPLSDTPTSHIIVISESRTLDNPLPANGSYIYTYEESGLEHTEYVDNEHRSPIFYRDVFFALIHNIDFTQIDERLFATNFDDFKKSLGIERIKSCGELFSNVVSEIFQYAHNQYRSGKYPNIRSAFYAGLVDAIYIDLFDFGNYLERIYVVAQRLFIIEGNSEIAIMTGDTPSIPNRKITVRSKLKYRYKYNRETEEGFFDQGNLPKLSHDVQFAFYNAIRELAKSLNWLDFSIATRLICTALGITFTNESQHFENGDLFPNIIVELYSKANNARYVNKKLDPNITPIQALAKVLLE